MLHAAETWVMMVATLDSLPYYDCAMICWICNVFLSKPVIQDLDVVFCTSRMRWFGQVEHNTGWIAKEIKPTVVTQKRPGRPKETLDELLGNELDRVSVDHQNHF